jgi:hypothetical protein
LLLSLTLPMVVSVGHAATILVQTPILSDTVWSSGNRYVVADDVHVTQGVTLTVQAGAEICIRNGEILSPRNRTGRSTLIFDSGSSLSAGTMVVNACDDQGAFTSKANNGGIVFLGTLKTSVLVYKDNLINNSWSPLPSHFSVSRLEMNHLGAEDSRPIWQNLGTKEPKVIDDWDAISFIGVSPAEWESANHIISNYSGQNGIDVLNSKLRISQLEIYSPVEDGINLTSSDLQILNRLVDLTYVTDVWDRDLFDFEVDWGYSLLQVLPGSSISLHGIFGDQLVFYPGDCPPKGIRRGLRDQDYVCSVSLTSQTMSVVSWGGAPKRGTTDPDG